MDRLKSFIADTLSLANGGEYSNDPSDLGGATRAELASRWHPDLRSDIVNGTLTEEKIYSVYNERYYSKIPRINEVAPSIGFVLFDTFVLGKARDIFQTIQIYLNMMEGTKLKLDGVYGEKTAAALANARLDTINAILLALYDAAPIHAADAARRVMAKQKAEGLVPKDYTNGYTRRMRNRILRAVAYVP